MRTPAMTATIIMTTMAAISPGDKAATGAKAEGLESQSLQNV